MKSIADLIEARFGLPTETGRDMPADGPLARILSRRSHRRFKAAPVAGELLDVLLACAQSASSKSDLMQYSIVVVQDPQSRRALADLGPHLAMAGEAPVLLAFCADVRRIRRLARIRGHEYANDNVDTFMNAVVDAALAFQTFTLAAESVGLGCCGLSAMRWPIERTSAIMELPDGVFPIAGMAVGWPAQEGWISMRLPVTVVVHRDRYDDRNLEAEIDAYDARRHDRHAITPERQRHADLYGVLDFCGWSENVARQLSLPERAEFKDFLASKGINLD